MTTMPGRGPERMTGSHIDPVTNPPSGLLKEIWLTSAPFIPDSGRHLQIQWRIDVVAEQGQLRLGRRTAEIRTFDRA